MIDKMTKVDNYDEFKPFCWNVFVSPLFANGLIQGYFVNKVPDDFFSILALYPAESLLGHIPWAMQFDDEEVKAAFEVYESVMAWFDDFKQTVPTWYQLI